MSKQATERATLTMEPEFCFWNDVFFDFERASEALRGFGLDWLQLDRGPTQFQLQQIGSPDALFTRLSVTRKYHQRGAVPAGTWTFAVIGRNAPHLEWRNKACTADHILLYPRNADYELVTHPGNHGDVISISDTSIRSKAEGLGLPDPESALPNGMAFLQVDPAQTEKIRDLVTQLHTSPEVWLAETGGPAAWSLFEDNLVAELISTILSAPNSSQPVPAPGKRNRALRRAIDFIRSHTDEPPTITEVCSAAGSSWRTLNYAFRECLGVTPKQYLQAFRLQGVHRQLLHPEGPASVSEAAANWGFWHMGKLAAAYRRQFGELPSDTLARTSHRSPAARPNTP